MAEKTKTRNNAKLKAKPKTKVKELEVWIVSISMGLGHQRATYPLKDMAKEKILLIGQKETSPEEEIKLLTKMTRTYEFISKMKKVPLIGNAIYSIVERIQYIPPLYPLRDMSEPCLNNKVVDRYLNKGLGATLMKKIMADPLPYISSYPIPAMIADHYDYGRNYCLICDAQINRGWVASNPKKSKMMYFAPCGHAVKRLRQYGVTDDRIFLTGFPMPKSLTGGPDLEILKYDLGQRLHYLDPNNRFWPLHGTNVEHFLGKNNTIFKNERVMSVTYAVGGAGALREVGIDIAISLKDYIKEGKIKVNLVAGIRPEVKEYFDEALKEARFEKDDVYVLYSDDIYDYFEKFNALMRVTDVLWTKPSELSFYAGLGLPIMMHAPLGSQEVYNRKWLVEIQAGIDQNDAKYTHQWFIDLWETGRLAEAAWDGFLKARKYGTFKIEEILLTGTMKREKSPLLR